MSELEHPSDQTPTGGSARTSRRILAILAAPLVFPLWLTLYPIPLLASCGVLLGLYLAVPDIIPNASELWVGLAIFLAVLVLWPASRLEHILARNSAYRVLRHVLRLMLFSTSAYYTHGILAAVAVAAGAHVLLMHFTTARTLWHECLEAIWLRPRSA